MITGTIAQDGSFWVVLIPLLGSYAHGRTPNAACRVAAEIIGLRAADYRPLDGFRIEVTDRGGGVVLVTSNDTRRLTSTLLRYQREIHGLSLADVAVKLGARSRTSYAVYEQGKAEPTIGKLEQLLAVVAPAGARDHAAPRRERWQAIEARREAEAPRGLTRSWRRSPTRSPRAYRDRARERHTTSDLARTRGAGLSRA